MRLSAPLAAALIGLSLPAHGSAGSALAVLPDSLLGLVPAPVAAPKPTLVPTKRFEDVVVELVDELSAKDPALFAEIRAEEARIRALPTRERRAAAVEAAYPLLERALDQSAADGKLSAEGAANWAAFRAQAKEAIAAGALFETAQFAGKAFDDRVRRLLDQGKTVLDPDRKLPETKAEYMRLSERIHAKLSVPGNSTALTTRQIDQAFALAGQEFGIRPDFLKYMAKTESGLRQTVPSNPAASGIMQIERVHAAAYAGERNVENDTITNIVFGGLLRAQTDREIARRFAGAGLALPSNPRVVEFLGDLAYNRGPGLLRHVARFAAEQEIDVNRFADYVGGPGGSYEIRDGGKSLVVIPGPGTEIDKTGRNSVLAKSSEAVGRVQFSKKLAMGLGDRNGDGRVDHLDVWLTRGIKYLGDPKLQS
ncbi:MAG: transglycosylase SLT domain-containing protein [Elusimicrobia bacterium]|nr:transglycosylase SLT domain-containing protein [Elusimicrobiota bacterium]